MLAFHRLSGLWDQNGGNLAVVNDAEEINYTVQPFEVGSDFFVVVDAVEANSEGDYVLWSHYGRCDQVPAPQCVNDADCGLGGDCNELSQCTRPIGTCNSPVDITDFGLYEARLGVAPNREDSGICDACPSPVSGACGETVYRYVPVNRTICVDTTGSNFDSLFMSVVDRWPG